jgi:hypothetical protein
MGQSGSEHQLWFTRRRGAVSGPYPSGLVSRYLILGRLDLDDQVSVDRARWRPISEVAELVPPEMQLPDNAEGRDARLRARLREDERRSVNRREDSQEGPAGERRRVERRAPEPAELIHHRIQRDRVTQAQPREEIPGSVPWVVAGAAVAAVLGLLMLQGDGGRQQAEPDCLAPAGPGVNWSYCRKGGLDLRGVDLSGSVLMSTDFMAAHLSGARLSGADLDYADMRRADLRRSDLTRASLVGAILQESRLEGASLAGANLTYADLRGSSLEGVSLEGVQLGRAVWVDGRVCAEGSVGECL